MPQPQRAADFLRLLVTRTIELYDFGMTTNTARAARSEALRRLESLDPAALDAHQLARLNALLAKILPQNRFYADKLGGLTIPLPSLDELADLPFTLKTNCSTRAPAIFTPPT